MGVSVQRGTGVPFWLLFVPPHRTLCHNSNVNRPTPLSNHLFGERCPTCRYHPLFNGELVEYKYLVGEGRGVLFQIMTTRKTTFKMKEASNPKHVNIFLLHTHLTTVGRARRSSTYVRHHFESSHPRQFQTPRQTPRRFSHQCQPCRARFKSRQQSCNQWSTRQTLRDNHPSTYLTE
jgi:hypothetical protein